VNQDSADRTATRYGLDDPGIETGDGKNFRTQPDRPWGPPSLCTMSIGSFTGVKRQGRDVHHSRPSSAEIKEKVELYYSVFRAGYRANFTSTFKKGTTATDSMFTPTRPN